MSPRTRARIRRARRIVLRVLLVAVALVVLAVGTAIAALHTAWGREQVRAEVEAILDDSFVGEVSIGRLEGSIFGVVTLRDVVIRDAAGDPAITAASMRVDLALLPLLDDRVRFQSVVIDGLVVDGRPLPDGRFNLAALTEAQDEPPGWDLIFDDIVVRGAALSIADPERIDHFDGLDLRAELAVPRVGGMLLEVEATGIWRERALPVRLAAQVGTEVEATTRIPRLEAGLGAIAVTARDVRIRGDEVSGAVTIDAPAAAIRAVVADSPLRGDVHLELDARTLAGGVIAVGLGGTVGGATIDGAVLVAREGARLSGRIGIAGADAAAIVTDGLRTDIDAAITFDVAQADTERRGVATVRARGTGEGELRADLDAVFLVDGEALYLGGGRLDASTSDLAAAIGGDAPVAGRATAVVAAHGRLAPGRPELLGTARIVGRDLVIDRRPAGDLYLDARSRPDGAIAVRARSVPPWTPFRLDVDAVVRLGADEVRVALGEHRLRTYGVDWFGRGGEVAIRGDKVQVARLRTTIAKGHLVVDGTYQHGGRHAGDFATSIHLDHLDLETIDRSLRLREPLRGRVDAQVHVVKRGRRWYGSVGGDADQLVIREGAEPIDVRAEARLAPGGVRIDASVTGRRVGTATVDVDVVAPRRLEDPAAWTRLERDAIRRGRIVLDRLDLAALGDLAGRDPQGATLEGRVDGELTLTATESHGRIVATGVRNGEIPAPLDAVLTIDQVGAETVTAQLTATVREVGTAHGEATVAIPARPFDLAAWAGIDAGAVRGATIWTDTLVLDRRRSELLGLGETYAGRGNLRIEIAAGLRSLTAHLAVDDLRGGPLARPVDLRIEAAGDAGGATATLTGAVAGTQVLTGEAEVTVELEALRRGRVALRDVPVTGTLVVDSKLRPLAAALGRDQRLVGTVDATVTVAGTLGAPTATAAVELAGVGVGKARLRSMTVDATWDGRIVAAAARGSQRDGGWLRIDARADVENLSAATAAIEADGFDLHPLAQLGPSRFVGIAGLLDADLQVRGLDPATARVDGTARLEEARLPLGGTVGTLRDGAITLSLRGGKLAVRGEGRIGAGRARLKMNAILRGMTPRRGDLDLSVEGITLIGEVQPRVSGRVVAKLGRDGGGWKVDSTVREARVVVPEGEGVPLHEPGLPEDMVIIENGRPAPSAIEPEDTWKDLLGKRPTAPWMKVAIAIQPVRVETPEFRGKIGGELVFTIGDDGIAVDGELEATTGSVALFDRRYRIDHAAVNFDGSVDPLLDLQLIHEFPQVTMFVAVRGRLSQPDLELSSRPATYTEGQLLSFLLGGSPGMNPGSEVRDAASGVASALLSKKIGGYVGDYLPVEVDVLRFEAATASSSAAFTVGKWLSRRLFVAYRRRLDARTDQNAGEAEVEYWLRPEILVEATVGDRGHHDADLLWLKRW